MGKMLCKNGDEENALKSDLGCIGNVSVPSLFSHFDAFANLVDRSMRPIDRLSLVTRLLKTD